MAVTTTKKIAGTIVRPCTCKHEFQDKEYGKDLRLANVTSSGSRCTVCGKEK